MDQRMQQYSALDPELRCLMVTAVEPGDIGMWAQQNGIRPVDQQAITAWGHAKLSACTVHGPRGSTIVGYYQWSRPGDVVLLGLAMAAGWDGESSYQRIIPRDWSRGVSVELPRISTKIVVRADTTTDGHFDDLAKYSSPAGMLLATLSLAIQSGGVIPVPTPVFRHTVIDQDTLYLGTAPSAGVRA